MEWAANVVRHVLTIQPNPSAPVGGPRVTPNDVVVNVTSYKGLFPYYVIIIEAKCHYLGK